MQHWHHPWRWLSSIAHGLAMQSFVTAAQSRAVVMQAALRFQNSSRVHLLYSWARLMYVSWCA